MVSLQSDVIYTPAAKTAVDKVERESEQARLANQNGVSELARAARDCGALAIHYSTDLHRFRVSRGWMISDWRIGMKLCLLELAMHQWM